MFGYPSVCVEIPDTALGHCCWKAGNTGAGQTQKPNPSAHWHGQYSWEAEFHLSGSILLPLKGESFKARDIYTSGDVRCESVAPAELCFGTKERQQLLPVNYGTFLF